MALVRRIAGKSAGRAGQSPAPEAPAPQVSQVRAQAAPTQPRSYEEIIEMTSGLDVPEIIGYTFDRQTGRGRPPISDSRLVGEEQPYFPILREEYIDNPAYPLGEQVAVKRLRQGGNYNKFNTADAVYQDLVRRYRVAEQAGADQGTLNQLKAQALQAENALRGIAQGDAMQKYASAMRPSATRQSRLIQPGSERSDRGPSPMWMMKDLTRTLGVSVEDITSGLAQVPMDVRNRVSAYLSVNPDKNIMGVPLQVWMPGVTKDTATDEMKRQAQLMRANMALNRKAAPDITMQDLMMPRTRSIEPVVKDGTPMWESTDDVMRAVANEQGAIRTVYDTDTPDFGSDGYGMSTQSMHPETWRMGKALGLIGDDNVVIGGAEGWRELQKVQEQVSLRQTDIGNRDGAFGTDVSMAQRDVDRAELDFAQTGYDEIGLRRNPLAADYVPVGAASVYENAAGYGVPTMQQINQPWWNPYTVKKLDPLGNVTSAYTSRTPVPGENPQEFGRIAQIGNQQVFALSRDPSLAVASNPLAIGNFDSAAFDREVARGFYQPGIQAGSAGLPLSMMSVSTPRPSFTPKDQRVLTPVQTDDGVKFIYPAFGSAGLGIQSAATRAGYVTPSDRRIAGLQQGIDSGAIPQVSLGAENLATDATIGFNLAPEFSTERRVARPGRILELMPPSQRLNYNDFGVGMAPRFTPWSQGYDQGVLYRFQDIFPAQAVDPGVAQAIAHRTAAQEKYDKAMRAVRNTTNFSQAEGDEAAIQVPYNPAIRDKAEILAQDALDDMILAERRVEGWQQFNPETGEWGESSLDVVTPYRTVADQMQQSGNRFDDADQRMITPNPAAAGRIAYAGRSADDLEQRPNTTAAEVMTEREEMQRMGEAARLAKMNAFRQSMGMAPVESLAQAGDLNDPMQTKARGQLYQAAEPLRRDARQRQAEIDQVNWENQQVKEQRNRELYDRAAWMRDYLARKQSGM